MSERRQNGPRMGGPGRRAGMMPGEKAKNFKGYVFRLLEFLKPFAPVLTVFNIIGPKILGTATTTQAEGLALKYTGNGGIDFNKIADILTKLLIINILSAAFSYIQSLIMAGVTQKVTYK